MVISNADYNAATAGRSAAQDALAAAERAHRDTPARLPLHQVNPGQQILDTQTKLLTHTIKIGPRSTPPPRWCAIYASTPATPAPPTRHTP